MKKRSQIRLKIAIVLAMAFVWFIIGVFVYINSPKVQSKIVAAVNRISDLNISFEKLEIDILGRKIIASNITLENKKKGQRFFADKVGVKFNILPLFKGSLKFREINVNNMTADISPATEIQKKETTEISLTNLLLMRNLRVEKGTVKHFEARLPKGKLTANGFEFSFMPSIWGDIKLTIDLESAEFSKEGKVLSSIYELTIGGRTNVHKWIDVFPYIDHLDGEIRLSRLVLPNMEFSNLSVDTNYSDKKIGLYPLTVTIKEDTIKITGYVDLEKEKYSLDIDITEPVHIPSFGDENTFVKTEGHLGGKIAIDGNGLNWKNTKAEVEFDLGHALANLQDLPVSVVGKATVSDGKISLIQTTLAAEDCKVNVAGDFDYLKPNLALSFEGTDVPIESVMRRFTNKHFHPAVGLAKATGKFSGWKPNLTFNLSVQSGKGSYYDILADSVEMDLEMTYHKLELHGRVFQGEDEAGTIDLNMQLGEKLPDGTRKKRFELTAKVQDANLSKAFADYGLTGIGSGTLEMTGSPKDFNGNGKIAISNGGLKGLEFSHAETNIKLSPKKVIFDNIRVTSEETNPSETIQPITMDIEPSGVHLYGTPRPEVSVDAKYNSNSSQWSISEISYASKIHPEWKSKLTGTVSKGGALNLKLNGMFDTSTLSYLRGVVRNAEGPLKLQNINITGPSQNPSIAGIIVLEDNSLYIKTLGYALEKLAGTVKLNGHTITTDDLNGKIEYGDFFLKGSLTHQNAAISQSDIAFTGRNIRYATSDKSFRTELDCDLKLKGGPTSSIFEGNINILDGKYTKKFSVFDSLKKKPAIDTSKTAESSWKGMRLALKIKTNGDLKIDNNIGEIWLGADLSVTGFNNKPNISGNIESLGGQLHYAGLDFEVTKGYIEFRDPYTNPYMELTSTKEIGDYTIQLILTGRFDNLYLDLRSTPPLERKDIFAILSSGSTEEDIRSNRVSSTIGTGVVAEQVGAVLQGPITKFTPIDKFRVESAPASSGGGTRVSVGKSISDRLKVYFITDINTTDALQTYQAEYLLTDFLLLKGARTSNSAYRFYLSLRFREQ